MDARKIKTHPVSPLLVPLAYMADLNFSAEQCLKGTDLTFEQVASNQVLPTQVPEPVAVRLSNTPRQGAKVIRMTEIGNF